ncbi:MAG: squalene/phytoene synthase family protein [Chloroflexi bacterium]|nr:squalene/phytoene synthase family protein [Chloroflexota bacterium]
MDLKEMLRISSRTFAIGIERLPKELSHALTIAYLLLRVSDYLEDNVEMPPQQKVRLLYLWDKVLGEEIPIADLMSEMTYPPKETADSTVARRADYLLTELATLPEGMRRPILKHVRDSTIGMARWVARGPLVNNEADMDDYMHEVAGRVGYLVTELFAWYSYTIRQHLDTLIPLAREFGLALQTVNVIRGLRDDYERGWIFVPESFCATVNLSREALFDPAHEQEALVVVDMLIKKAERHLEVAITYLKSLPPWQHSIRLACMFPLLFAVRTLAICRNSSSVLYSEAKMQREEVKKIVRDSTLWGWSNWWVDYYCRQLNIVLRP